MSNVKRVVLLFLSLVLVLCMCACSGSDASGVSDTSDTSEPSETFPGSMGTKVGELTFVPEPGSSEDEFMEVPYGAFDDDGNQILPYEYDIFASYVADDRYIVNNIVQNTGTILIDGKGNVIVPSGYTLTTLGFDGEQGDSGQKNWITAKRQSDGMCGFMDPVDGSLFIEPKYLNADPFSEGYAAVQDENNMWGIIDEKGEYVIPPEYDMYDSRCVSEDIGIAATDKNGEHVFIVKDEGEVRVMRPEVPVRSISEFPELEFADGLAVVMEYKEDDDWNEPTGKCGVIDKHGKIVVPLEHDDWSDLMEYMQ